MNTRALRQAYVNDTRHNKPEVGPSIDLALDFLLVNYRIGNGLEYDADSNAKAGKDDGPVVVGELRDGLRTDKRHFQQISATRAIYLGVQLSCRI